MKPRAQATFRWSDRFYSLRTVGQSCKPVWSERGAPSHHTMENRMPIRSQKPCAHPGCPSLVRPPASRCERHPLKKPPKAVDPFYVSKEWAVLRARFLKLVGKRCQICGSDDRVAVHHITPRKEGGGDVMSNLKALCHGCHNRAHSAREIPRETW